MKKRIKIFAGALAAVLILSASVAYALSAEPEAAKASGREQVLDTVSVCAAYRNLAGADRQSRPRRPRFFRRGACGRKRTVFRKRNDRPRCSPLGRVKTP